MLAITANWRLTDGSLAESGAVRAMARLDAIRRAVVRAGCGRDGRYQPLDEVCLVLAGDTFDWLLSDAWQRGDRPWHGGERGRRARLRAAVRSLRATIPAVRHLARWARRGLSVPAADGRGRPSTWAVQPVAVRPVLLAGDRDWWVVEWAERLDRHGIAVGEAWSDGVRHVRHGHDRDPLACRARALVPTGAVQPTLAESAMLDLLVPFAVAIREDGRLWPTVRPSLQRFAAAHLAAWPRLVAELASGAAGDPKVSRTIRSTWQRRVADWFAVARRETPACEAEFDAVAALAGWFDQLRTEHEAPPDLLRLTATLGRRSMRAGEITAHADAEASRTLVCHAADGRTWREPLDRPAPGPAVVAIGGRPAGSGFVDAA
jgi:hypothetical protein